MELFARFLILGLLQASMFSTHACANSASHRTVSGICAKTLAAKQPFLESETTTLEWAKRNYEAAALNEIETKALFHYASLAYSQLNPKLRGGQMLTEGEEKFVKILDSTIDKGHLTQDTVLFRGIYFDSDADVEALNLIGGGVFTEKGYMSTSLSEEFAREWADESPRHARVMFKILALAGTHGRFMETGEFKKPAAHRNEWEILLPRNLKFIILKTERVSGWLEVTMQIIS